MDPVPLKIHPPQPWPLDKLGFIGGKIMRLRKVVPLAVLVTLGAGIACKKPVPAPVVDTSAEDAKRKAAEEEARKQREADEARRKAEAEEARRKAEADTYRKATESALKDINFDFDKYAIRDTDKAKLQGIADFLKQFGQAKLKIEGHCDERGTVEYNMALGEKRAAAAQAYLVSLGVSQDRLSTISFGKERPKVQGKDEESYLVNRRSEFKLQ
jgi:peptidoglycan-associated lipoprotein